MESILEGLDLPEEVKTTLSERVQSEIQAVKEGVKNDPEFIDSIRNAEAGKLYGSMESVFKRTFDYADGEIPEDVTGVKRMQAMLKVGLSKLERNKDATNQELQDEYLKLKDQFQRYKDEDVPALLEEKDKSYQARFIKDGIYKDASTFDLTIKTDAAPAIVDSFIGEMGWKKTWADGKYAFRTKDNLKPTVDGKPVTEKDVLEKAFEWAGVLQKSNGTDGERREHRRDNPGRRAKSENVSRMTEGMVIE